MGARISIVAMSSGRIKLSLLESITARELQLLKGCDPSVRCFPCVGAGIAASVRIAGLAHDWKQEALRAESKMARMIPRGLLAAGFRFRYPGIEEALRSIVLGG